MKNYQSGLEVFLSDKKLLQSLKKKRIAVVCHPASTNSQLQHSLDLISKKLSVTCAFGPQHGARGDKQDNMIESHDYTDPQLNIPIYSLYGEVRVPTTEMMNQFDVVIFDLQDLGCRIYTFITTLLYVMKECAKNDKQIIVLDRPNPAGRPVEGFRLMPGWESFVGAAPIPMRHGLTVGELAIYYNDFFNLELDLRVVKMKGYQPEKYPSLGWPHSPWVNPSPNAPSVHMARAYGGTVLLEGTHLSEGRGTTIPLSVLGAPDLNFSEILLQMHKLAPQWLKGCSLRECYFEPTFHKHQGKLCHGFQIHTDTSSYRHDIFRPFRLVALTLKSIRLISPEYSIYREFAYEYVKDKLPFDVINGGPQLRDWIEDWGGSCSDLDQALKKDEKSWLKERKKYLLY